MLRSAAIAPAALVRVGQGALATFGAAPAGTAHGVGRRRGWAVFTGIAALLPLLATQAAAAPRQARPQAPCPALRLPRVQDARVELRIKGLAPDGSLDLEDGRRFAPPRVSLPTRLEPDASVPHAAAQAVAQAFAGQTITLSRLETDRHGRLTGEAWLHDTAKTSADLPSALVAAGAGFAATTGPCAAPLKALEDAARDRQLGIWARPGAMPSAANVADLSARRGLYTVTEGRILAVGVKRERTYLNFGEIWRQDFTVIVPTSDFAIILGQGEGPGSDHDLSPDALRDARVRVRGVVQDEGGPAIMVTSRTEMERLADETGSEE